MRTTVFIKLLDIGGDAVRHCARHSDDSNTVTKSIFAVFDVDLVVVNAKFELIRFFTSSLINMT
jgi:hypothetical protein